MNKNKETLSECILCSGEMVYRGRQEQCWLVDDPQRGIFPVGEYRVEVPLYECTSCGLDLTDEEGDEIEEQASERYDAGLLNSYEIRMIRKRMGLSRSGLARLTGFSEASIKRWETGKLAQNRSADRFLRLLDADPAALHTLYRIAAQLPS